MFCYALLAYFFALFIVYCCALSLHGELILDSLIFSATYAVLVFEFVQFVVTRRLSDLLGAKY